MHGIIEAPTLKHVGYADKFTNNPTEIETALLDLMHEHNGKLAVVAKDFQADAGQIRADKRLTATGQAEELTALAKKYENRPEIVEAEKAAASWEARAAGIEAMLDKRLSELMPATSEVREREVRDLARGMSEADRVKWYLAANELEDFEVVRALENSFKSAPLLPADVSARMRQARREKVAGSDLRDATALRMAADWTRAALGVARLRLK